MVDVDHPDLAHAARDEFGMHVGENAEVIDAALAKIIEQLPNLAEVLDPQRNRRVLEETARIVLAQREQPPGALAFADVLNRDENPRPVSISKPGSNVPFTWMSMRRPPSE